MSVVSAKPPIKLFLWLTYLKRGTKHHRAILKFLREDLASTGFALADIDPEMTEVRLRRLYVESCRKAALAWLDYLKARHGDYARYLKMLHQELADGGFTLADIGVSEEMLSALTPAGAPR